jgi:hypothetical protein
MARFEVTAECTRIQTFSCDSADDARQEMFDCLEGSGMDAGRFSMSVVMLEDEDTPSPVTEMTDDDVEWFRGAMD